MVFLAVGAVAAAALLFAARWAVREALDPPDAELAREEVQRYYDQHFPRKYEVTACEYVVGQESANEDFACQIKRLCPPVRFSVPRAAALPDPLDADPRPETPARPQGC